jgi:hypothetical protein
VTEAVSGQAQGGAMWGSSDPDSSLRKLGDSLMRLSAGVGFQFCSSSCTPLFIVPHLNKMETSSSLDVLPLSARAALVTRTRHSGVNFDILSTSSHPLTSLRGHPLLSILCHCLSSAFSVYFITTISQGATSCLVLNSTAFPIDSLHHYVTVLHENAFSGSKLA